MSAHNLLDVQDLVVKFRLRSGDLTALNGINFTLNPGERMGLVGESGAGKSVAGFSIINLISKPGFIASGRVLFEGEEISAYPLEQMRDIRGNRISMIFQDPMMTLNPVLTIGTQMVETILAHNKVSVAHAREIALEKLSKVYISSPGKRLWSKNIVDYVLKEGGESLRYAVRQARRVILNREVKVLVVEDSEMVRTMVAGLLRVHRFQVFEACNGREGLQVLNANPDIRLIITDYEMPEMDGIRFVRAVRARHPKEEMAIIGISSHELESLSARFLKSGANDFLTKPFSSEEFYCRVSQNMDLLEYIQTIKDYSEKDFLTGLFNRRYLFAQAPSRIRKKQKRGDAVCLAMLDIDHFKKINDQYGHETGDVVLRDLGKQLRRHFAHRGIAARLGGEEFCLLLDDDAADAAVLLEEFRREVAATDFTCGGVRCSFSISIGLCVSTHLDLAAMLKNADEALYMAKNNGRNRLEIWTN